MTLPWKSSMTSNVAKTPCVEESERICLSLLAGILEYCRVSCVHQNIFTRKVTDMAFTSDFCNNHSHPLRPCIWCPGTLLFNVPRPCPTRPRIPYCLDVPKSFVSRPQVPSPQTRIPMSPSPCPHPTFIHSPNHFKTPRLYYKFSKEYFYKCPGTANSCS